MRILIEGEAYSLELLEELLENQSFYFVHGPKGIINHVGYFHSLKLEEVIYFLPKVFYWNNLILGEFDLELLASEKIEHNFKHDEKYHWIRHLLILFYKSLVEYKKRFPVSEIIEKQLSIELNSNLGEQEYSFLDLMLSFLNFYKKHQTFTAYQMVESRSKQAKKPKWTKTIRKTMPFVNEKGQPIYLQIHNKKRTQNREEDLITIFLSILLHFKKVHQLPIKIDKGFQLYTGKRFTWLQNNGLKVLRRVKYKYFSDILKRMYSLCKLYLNKTDKSNIRKRKSEYITVRNYNLVFEDMVDKLFSDDSVDSDIQNLKQNKDGKIIDHLFEHQSLIDGSHIFYIGDSKYYKSNHQAKGQSLYKQFTYAKNVIQFHINLFNEGQLRENLRYRDNITEGYNVSPNFFIYGFIPTNEVHQAIITFEESHLTDNFEVKSSYHFKGRLFDRDTLFVHQYQMNFLFILKAYTTRQISIIQIFRAKTKQLFRNNFIRYFNTQSDYEFYEKCYSTSSDLKQFVENNFRVLNGKCISLEEGTKLLVAVDERTDSVLKSILSDYQKIELI